MKTLFVVVFMALASVAQGQTVNLSFNSGVCAAYRGSWSDDSMLGPYDYRVSVSCVIKNNVGAVCKMTSQGKTDRYQGNFLHERSTRNFKVEAKNVNNSSAILQLVCKENGTCLAFRLFNEENMLGIQCLAREAIGDSY